MKNSVFLWESITFEIFQSLRLSSIEKLIPNTVKCLDFIQKWSNTFQNHPTPSDESRNVRKK